jgi:hypothetical protein
MTGNQGGPMRLARSALKWSLLAGRRHAATTCSAERSPHHGLDLRSQHPSVAQSPLAKCWQAGSDGLCLSLQEVETGGRSR